MLRISSIEKLIGTFIAFISCMLIVRMIYSGSNMYLFLLWNIFLACIPFEISALLVKRKRNKWAEAIFFSAWLLFFPNALYILTDLVHLEVKTMVPLWFDAILLFASASTGLIMAFTSLYKIETFLNSKVSSIVANGIILACLFLGSFGVYLGRFQRWNSWDIINEPFALLTSIAKLFIFPTHYTHAWAFTFVFAGFIYLLFYSVRHLGLKNKG
jgi:uncharacterized membrane protein